MNNVYLAIRFLISIFTLTEEWAALINYFVQWDLSWLINYTCIIIRFIIFINSIKQLHWYMPKYKLPCNTTMQQSLQTIRPRANYHAANYTPWTITLSCSCPSIYKKYKCLDEIRNII